MRKRLSCCVFFLLAATSAMAQVQVDVRLEKIRYLAGEPIVVLVDVRNVGRESVGYSECDGDVGLGSVPVVGIRKGRRSMEPRLHAERSATAPLYAQGNDCCPRSSVRADIAAEHLGVDGS